MDWTENKAIVEAYETAFQKAYEHSFEYFIGTMEEEMGSFLCDMEISKDVYNELLEEILDSARDHYQELQSKYAGG